MAMVVVRAGSSVRAVALVVDRHRPSRMLATSDYPLKQRRTRSEVPTVLSRSIAAQDVADFFRLRLRDVCVMMVANLYSFFRSCHADAPVPVAIATPCFVYDSLPEHVVAAVCGVAHD